MFIPQMIEYIKSSTSWCICGLSHFQEKAAAPQHEEDGRVEHGEKVEKEEDEVKVGDDPRAGSIHSVIPLLSVNYMKLSEKMLLQL